MERLSHCHALAGPVLFADFRYGVVPMSHVKPMAAVITRVVLDKPKATGERGVLNGRGIKPAHSLIPLKRIYGFACRTWSRQPFEPALLGV